mgnify:FL=1|tara:strand:+ start:335 stop:604 length:270 start_codon:yes stop_codon:yes gene_type:complete
MNYEQKAELQDSNKARMYEERYKKWRKKKTIEMYEEKKIIESIWDIIMKNTMHKNIDFTKFQNAFIDYDKKEIDLGNYVLSIKKKGTNE